MEVMGRLSITVSKDIDFEKVKALVSDWWEVEIDEEEGEVVGYDTDGLSPEYEVKALVKLDPEYFTVTVSDICGFGFAEYSKDKGEDLVKKFVSVEEAFKEFLKEDWWVEECLGDFEVESLEDIDKDDLREWILENHSQDVSDGAFYLIGEM